MFYINGTWVDEPNFPFDNIFIRRGYMVYETLRTYSNKLFAFKMHYERLKKSADFLGIDIPEYEKVKEILLEGISKCDFLGEKKISLYLLPKKKENLIVYIDPLMELNEEKENGVVLAIARERKPLYPVIPYYVKTPLSGFNFYLKQKYSSYYDVIVLNENGYVTEGTMSNIFLISAGVLITPSLNSGVLPGITRQIVLDMAKDMGIEFEERFVEIWELLSADEVFVTHTSVGIMPVRRIVPEFTFYVPGSITDVLLSNWIDFINNKKEYWED